MDTVKVVTGGQPQMFSFSLPGVSPPVVTTTVTGESAPMPKDGLYSTYLAGVRGTGAVTATVQIFGTNDPHAAGADNPQTGTRNNFQINTTNTSTGIVSPEGLFRTTMNGDEVFAVGVPVGTTMTYVSATNATLSAAATATGALVPARFQANYWASLGTITLNGTTQVGDGFATTSAWKWVKANVSAISGTNATVFVVQGV